MTAATTNRRLLVGAAAVGVVAGVVGIGASIAGLDDDREPAPRTTTTAATPATGAPTEPPPEAAEEEQPAAPEDDEAAEEAAEARLEADAAVTREQAEQIALGRVAGTVDRARIGDEGGTVAWEVRVDGADGHVDVQVDATTGAILAVDD